MFRLHGVTPYNTRVMRTLRPFYLNFARSNTPYRKLSTKTEDSKGSSSPVLLEYKGVYTESYKKLKLFSISSLALATMVTPLMFLIESSIPTGGKAILGITAMSTSSLSTALIAWAGSSYVTQLRIEDTAQITHAPAEQTGTRLEFTTTTIFLRDTRTIVYDPMFLETTEDYFIKVRLRSSIRIPMAEVEKQGMKLTDGQEETVAESLDSSGNVKGWWAVKWRQEGNAGFVGECRGVGNVRSGFNIDPDIIRNYMKR